MIRLASEFALALARVPILMFRLFANLIGGNDMPVTDAQAEKFANELADLLDLALDKISNKTQINQFFAQSMDVYGVIAGMDFSDAQRAALAFHVGAAIMARSKKYFPLNPPPVPVP